MIHIQTTCGDAFGFVTPPRQRQRFDPIEPVVSDGLASASAFGDFAAWTPGEAVFLQTSGLVCGVFLGERPGDSVEMFCQVDFER